LVPSFLSFLPFQVQASSIKAAAMSAPPHAHDVDVASSFEQSLPHDRRHDKNLPDAIGTVVEARSPSSSRPSETAAAQAAAKTTDSAAEEGLSPRNTKLKEEEIVPAELEEMADTTTLTRNSADPYSVRHATIVSDEMDGTVAHPHERTNNARAGSYRNLSSNPAQQPK